MAVPVVTAVRRVASGTRSRGGGRERVEVCLDGRPWRVIPLGAAVEARLEPGVRLDRVRARALNRALRRERATGSALTALRFADHSRASLTKTLEQRGVRPEERGAAVERVVEAGLVDDGRFARNRAATLAARGAGNAMVADDLRARGIGEEHVRAAIAGLDPESERARALVRERGASPRTLRFLASRGFAEDFVDDLVAQLREDELG